MQPTTTTTTTTSTTPTNGKPFDLVDAIFTNSDILMDMDEEEEEGGGYDLINNLNKDTIEDMMAYSRFPISAYYTAAGSENAGGQWRSGHDGSGHDESNNDYDERGSNDNDDASGSSVAVGGRSSRSSGSSSSSSGSSTTLLQGMMLGEDDLVRLVLFCFGADEDLAEERMKTRG